MTDAAATRPDKPIVYTPAQVAELLQCSVATVLRAIRAGRLPAFYISPQRPRVPAVALERWLDAQAQESLANGHVPPENPT